MFSEPTVDPIRDGNNWFAYVNNDPVNWVDLWGLEAVDIKIQPRTGSFPDGSPEQNAAWDRAEAARVGLRFEVPLETTKVTSSFGHRTDAVPEDHDGVDYSAPKGTPVYASEAGTVTMAEIEPSKEVFESQSSNLRIDHGKEWQSRYLHMDSFTVEEGDEVTKGQLVGYTGTRKNVAPHLHFEIRKNKVARNPEHFF